MKYKFIPVNNDLTKAISFANTLDKTNITSKQRIKLPSFYIDSLDVIKQFQNEGWILKGVNEARLKNRKVNFNYAQLIHPDIITKNKSNNVETNMSLTLENSCDGSKPFKASLGAFRQVCSNGLIAFDNVYNMSIKHIEKDIIKLPTLISSVNTNALALNSNLENMRHKVMTEEEMKQFAMNAAILKYSGDQMRNIDVNDLLKVNRSDDEGNSVWSVYNRVQENLTHDVINLQNDITLNKQLFKMASNALIV